MIQRFIFAICTACCIVCLSCSEGGVEPDYSSITDPKARWQAYGFTDYTIDQILDCFCPYGGIPIRVVVRNSQIFNVSQAGNGLRLPDAYWGQFRSVDGLFDEVEAVNPDSVSVFTVMYDAKYGIPTVIYVDPGDSIADDEYGYRTSNFGLK